VHLVLFVKFFLAYLKLYSLQHTENIIIVNFVLRSNSLLDNNMPEVVLVSGTAPVDEA
jgi:hypothetical protein